MEKFKYIFIIEKILKTMGFEVKNTSSSNELQTLSACYDVRLGVFGCLFLGVTIEKNGECSLTIPHFFGYNANTKNEKRLAYSSKNYYGKSLVGIALSLACSCKRWAKANA